MIALGLDCAQKNVTLVLIQGDRIVAHFNGEPESSQSEALIQLVADLFNQAGLSLKDVDEIYYGYGPGSFTALRIGLAALTGLFWGQKNIRTYGVSSLLLRCLSYQTEGIAGERNRLVGLLPLGRKKVAVGELEGTTFIEDVLETETFEARRNEIVGEAQHIDFSKDPILETAFLKLRPYLPTPTPLSELKLRYGAEPDISKPKKKQ